MSAKLSNEQLHKLVSFRRDLHAHPETAFDLERTSEIVAEKLHALGMEVTTGVGRSGVVGTLRRGDSNRAIGFRADMDALPITEANTFDHVSTIPGKFHGCGHDGHTTMLLGAATQLAADDTFKGTVHFIFQPDEENGEGAKAMVDDGLFDRFPMDAVYGMHNMPGMPLGHFATQAGPFCAFEDNFEIAVQGRGGHASMPEIAIDPIVIGSKIVTDLQSIVSRNISAREHAVVSVTNFETDGARNILASNVSITGDCRGFEQHVSDTIRERMEQIIEGNCRAHGAQWKFDYSTSFSPLINDPAHTELAAGVVEGLENTQMNSQYGRVGFSEDFCRMLEKRPGAFVLMGNGTSGSHAQPLHNPSYDFNDEAIAYGVEYWCALAKRALAE